MNRLIVSGLAIVIITASGTMAYGLATQSIPIHLENQVQMVHLPNSYDGRSGYSSILNEAMSARQGSELDIVLPAIVLDNASMVEEISAVTQAKINSQTGLMWSHGKNCRVE